MAGTTVSNRHCALGALGELGHRVVLCEGGPTWLGELAAADRLDELCLIDRAAHGRRPAAGGGLAIGAPIAEVRAAPRPGQRGRHLFLRYERAEAGPR